MKYTAYPNFSFLSFFYFKHVYFLLYSSYLVYVCYVAVETSTLVSGFGFWKDKHIYFINKLLLLINIFKLILSIHPIPQVTHDNSDIRIFQTWNIKIVLYSSAFSPSSGWSCGLSFILSLNFLFYKHNTEYNNPITLGQIMCNCWGSKYKFKNEACVQIHSVPRECSTVMNGDKAMCVFLLLSISWEFSIGLFT